MRVLRFYNFPADVVGEETVRKNSLTVKAPFLALKCENSTFPSASDAMQVVYQEGRGRFVVAKRYGNEKM